MHFNRTHNLCSRIIGLLAGALPRLAGGNGASASCPAAEVRPATAISKKSLWLWTALIITCLVPFQAIAASNGDKIINWAQLTTSELTHVSTTSTVTLTMQNRTKSAIEFLTYAPATAGAPSIPVPKTSYQTDSAGSFAELPPPTLFGSATPIDLSAPLPLLPTKVLHAGEPVFIRVTDLDQNLDKTVTETIIVTVSDPTTGDTLTLRLTESGPDTGLFTGYFQTTSSASPVGKGSLAVIESSQLKAHYIDHVDGTDSSTDAALVDPYGIVFDTVTGKPVDGVTIELLDAASGLPAVVLGDNGVSGNIYPSKIISGGTATDAQGKVYSFPQGSYRFPYVAAGNYILKVAPSDRYIVPSTKTTAQIQALPGAPFTILEPGSRGETFAVPVGPAIRVDLPVDPKIGSLWLSKNAGKSIVSTGEFLSYNIRLENSDPVGTLFATVISDRLPPGFSYKKGSARINDIPTIDPQISPDGSTLTFTIGTIPPATALTLRYVTSVGAGARPGTAVNTASATTTPAVAIKDATATVTVQEPFMQSRALIMGRVFVGNCTDNPDEMKKGMEGVGIYLEDGTFVFSDKFGMFHFEGVRPGSHVVQLDLDSIPAGYTIQQCEENSRFAGRAYSQFVDLQGGTMWRTDFYLGRISPPAETASTEKMAGIGMGAKASVEPAPVIAAVAKKAAPIQPATYKGEITLELLSSQRGDFIDYRIPLHAHTVPLKDLLLTVTLPEGAIYQPGSSSFNDQSLTDPQTSGTILRFPLENANELWRRELHFTAKIDKSRQAGEFETSAILRFDTEASKGVLTPELVNTLSLAKGEKIIPLPLFVFRPHFPTFGDELSDADRAELDGLVARLSGKVVQKIEVTGHTDNVRIAPRSRHIHADNIALSLARARSVGNYLAAALQLPPEALQLQGKGQNEPIATNRTAEGKALNRRVEVRVTAVERIETSTLTIIKERSGIKKMETIGLPQEIKPAVVEPLMPLQPLINNETPQSVSDATKNPEAALEAGSNIATKSGAKSAQTAVVAAISAVDFEGAGENAKMIAVMRDEVVQYRVRINNLNTKKGKLKISVKMPDNLLYMSGSSSFNGAVIADPEAKDSMVSYDLAVPPEKKSLLLGFQGVIDGERTDKMSGSASVQVFNADGSLATTLSAQCELSDNTALLAQIEYVQQPPAEPTAAETVQAEQKELRKRYEEFSEKSGLPGATNSLTGAAAFREADESVTGQQGIHSPADGSTVVNRINAVRLILDSQLKPVLAVDGKEISDERIGFTMKDNKSGKTLYSYIGIDLGDAGDHTVTLQGKDTFGNIRYSSVAKIKRAGEIVAIKIISTEGNIADGKTPLKIQLQLLDRQGNIVRAAAELTIKSGDIRPQLASEFNRIGPVNTVMVDADGFVYFQPVSSSGLYRFTLGYGQNLSVDADTYVKPKMRDNWILVGIAEGTAGYNTVSGHMENLKASGTVEHFYDKERLAFYAKGTIKGEWLLTMAYDSAKQRTGMNGNSLFQTIDPNSYYTLYGDGASQGYDAASQGKIYLKIERDQFYAMFGDYDTGLTVTELSRYSRRLNGVKSEYRSKNLEATVFGSETAQAYGRDELRGDGTSGLYSLSKKGLVFNTEKITIESRDRFHSEVVTSSKQLSRFVDYSIDYESGKIFFKSPVPSRDAQLNPVYIVVEYEVMNPGMNAVTYGGHATATLLDGKLKAGASYIHEGHLKGESNLYGVDTNVDLGSGTKARAEFATTANDLGTTRNSGNAYLAEVTHIDQNLSGKAYYREQDQSFGLGQQKGSESGTRKLGVEGLYNIGRQVSTGGQAYRQYTLATGAVRDFIEGNVTYTDKQYTAKTGLRYANDTLADGSNQTSVQATAGGSWKTLDQKLTLRADREQSIYKNNNIDFPTRTTVGADYQLSMATTIFAQEELINGASENINTSSVGLKTTPWSGGSLTSSVVNDMRENSERTFATVGLSQKWQINRQWAADAGLDHSETLRKRTGYTLNSNVPPASGANEDFTAVSLGANYSENKLNWSNRVEYRTSESEDKWGLITGVVNEQGLNWGWTTRLQLLHSQSNLGTSKSDADLRLGLAYRPPVTKWIVLDRLDLIGSDEKTQAGTAHGRRIINNINANYKRDRKMQLSIQYGAKYVFEQLDAMDFSGYTDLIGLEGRYDITKHWDISARGTMLHTWESKQYATSFGPSIGYNIMENAWISVGYNIKGYYDRDFSLSNYTTQGPYVQFRFKFDQNSIKEGLKIINQ